VKPERARLEGSLAQDASCFAAEICMQSSYTGRIYKYATRSRLVRLSLILPSVTTLSFVGSFVVVSRRQTTAIFNLVDGRDGRTVA